MTEIPYFTRKEKLRTTEAAEYLKYQHGIIIAPATLNKKRSVGGGPEFHKTKSSRAILYPRIELDVWAADQLGGLKANTAAD
ncbi:MAG: hypothetical protein AAF580_05940 [Pseudomonadota bacterium]